MSGKYNGAQAKLSEFLWRLIPNIMCMGHKTNLRIEHSSKESRIFEVFFTNLQNLYNFFTKSRSRFDIYTEKVEELQEELIMNNLSVIRWIGRTESRKAVRKSFEDLLCILKDLSMNGNDKNCRTTASNLLEELKDVNFYISLVFMRNIKNENSDIKWSRNWNGCNTSRWCYVTYKEFKRIGNGNEEVVRLVKLDADNATKSEVNPYYEFEKKNRMKMGNAVKEQEENCEKNIMDVFITDYKCELNKVLDRLISDIMDIYVHTWKRLSCQWQYYIRKTSKISNQLKTVMVFSVILN